MRSALHVALLVVLIVGAGCLGTDGTTTSPVTDTTVTTETTASPETTTTTATTTTTTAAPELAPGLTESGVEGVTALADAHAESLDGRSYTVDRIHVERAADGTVLERNVSTAKYGESATLYELSFNGTQQSVLGNATGHVEVWSNGSAAYTANTAGRNASYSAGAALSPSDDYHDRIYQLFLTIDTNVTGQTPEGRYTVEATGFAYPDGLAGERFDSVENVSLTATITADGLVEEHRVAYTGVTPDGDRIRIVEATSFGSFGDTTVERPDWLANATAAD